MPSCGPSRSMPRNCTPEHDGIGNFPAEVVDNPELRERLRGLLDRIFQYIELHDNEEEAGCLE